MCISDLFDELNDTIGDDLKGELTIKGNCIIWTYDLDNDSEDIEDLEDYDDEFEFSFDAISPEELLLEAFHEDKEKIEEFLDENDEFDKWNLSLPETKGNVISFKIF